MAKFKSVLTWSFSRSRLFQECRRAYYYNYYASWGGWEAKADEFCRKAYILKNMQNVDTWVGDMVHQLIKWVLEQRIKGTEITYEEAANRAKRNLTWTWEQSRSEMWRENVKKNLNLFEHYYKQEPDREELFTKMQKVTKSLHAIYNSGILATISSLPKENVLAMDELDSFQFEGVKVFAVPDFALKKENYIMFDWKTGKPSEKDRQQLSLYILYAMEKWKVSLENIRIVPVYLAQPEVSFTPVAPVAPEEMRSFIRSSLKAMRSVLSDPAQNKADPELCFKTEEAWRCNKCKFREICS